MGAPCDNQMIQPQFWASCSHSTVLTILREGVAWLSSCRIGTRTHISSKMPNQRIRNNVNSFAQIGRSFVLLVNTDWRSSRSYYISPIILGRKIDSLRKRLLCPICSALADKKLISMWIIFARSPFLSFFDGLYRLRPESIRKVGAKNQFRVNMGPTLA